MALTANAAREQAEQWLQHVQGFLNDTRDHVQNFLNDTRDEVERRVDEVFGRFLGALQIVTTSDVAELDAKLKTIAKRLDQIEQRGSRKQKS